MLLNLGLTADAAAAHESEFVDSRQESQLSSSTPYSPFSSCAVTPLLGSLYNRYKGTETPESQQKHGTDMSASNSESLSPSDGESSLVDPAPTPSQLRRSYSKKRFPRPKTTYQLAHPVAHARHNRLKLRPKLLLQLQQVSHTPRPLPVLDVLPSTVYLPRLARKFPTVFGGRNGLGPNDLIIGTSDLYERALDTQNKRRTDGKHQDVVATICQLRSEDALARGKADICFNDGPAWEATPLPNGSYEFVANTEHGRQTVRWVLRGSKSRRPSGAGPHEDAKRFTFSMINPSTRRHPVAAAMTRNKLDVYDEYSIPSSVPKSPVTTMSMASDASQVDSQLEGSTFTTDDRLRTLIVVTSIWVAFREGWSHNFSYADTASRLNSKAIRAPTSPKANLPATPGSENASVPELNGHSGTVSNVTKPHATFSNIPHSHTVPDGDWSRSAPSGKLSKRSNSTSSTFLRLSSRHGSPGADGRENRHPMPSKTNHNQGRSRSNSTNPEQDDLNTQFHTDGDKAKAKYARNRDPVGNSTPEEARSARPAKSQESMSRVSADFDGAKSKRRHRLSTMFDLLKKKGAH